MAAADGPAPDLHRGRDRLVQGANGIVAVRDYPIPGPASRRLTLGAVDGGITLPSSLRTHGADRFQTSAIKGIQARAMTRHPLETRVRASLVRA